MVHISPSRWLLAGEAQLAPADKLPRMRACLSPVDVMSGQHSTCPRRRSIRELGCMVVKIYSLAMENLYMALQCGIDTPNENVHPINGVNRTEVYKGMRTRCHVYPQSSRSTHPSLSYCTSPAYQTEYLAHLRAGDIVQHHQNHFNRSRMAFRALYADTERHFDTWASISFIFASCM